MMEMYSIASGSSGNCICIGSDACHILIDAGISGKRIEEGLNAIDLKTADMQGILITHEHMDHISGLGVLARRYGLPIYATAGTIDAILHTGSVGKIDEGLFRTISPGTGFSIGDLDIESIRVSHDAADPVAYKVRCRDKNMAVMTDLGYYDETVVAALKDADVMLLEANHDVNMLQVGSYPYPLKQRILSDRGHLSNEACGQLLGEVFHDGLKAVLLGHLSKENNYEALAYETVRLEAAMGEDSCNLDDFPMYVAKRDQPSPLIRI